MDESNSNEQSEQHLLNPSLNSSSSVPIQHRFSIDSISSTYTKISPLAFSGSSASSATSASSIDSPTSLFSPKPNPPQPSTLPLLSSEPPRSESLANLLPIVSFDRPEDATQVVAHDPFGLHHSEFGFDGFNQRFRWVSQFRPKSSNESHLHEEEDRLIEVPVDSLAGEEPEEPGYWVYLSTYFSYLILILLGCA